MSGPNWKTIAESFKAKIASGELAPGDRIPSDAALAEVWKVSRPTAHRALHELQRLGLVTRSRGAGTSVAQPKDERTHRIALILDDVAQAYDFPQADLIRGLQETIGHSYSLLWCDSRRDAKREAQLIERMRQEADGIVCFPNVAPDNMPLYADLAATNHPFVVLDRIPEGLNNHAVMSDHYGATLRAVRALTQRGHRRIAFLTFHKPHFSSVRDRYNAYLAALEEAGAPQSNQLVRWFSADLEKDQPIRLLQAIQDSLVALTKTDDPVTAVFCVQDQLSQTVLSAADNLGIKIPEDLEVATFNDWPPMILGRPWDLHRVTPRAREIGRLAGERLLALISGDSPEPRVTLVDAEFFIADAGLSPSTARLNSKH